MDAAGATDSKTAEDDIVAFNGFRRRFIQLIDFEQLSFLSNLRLARHG
jgi:hypothetical protein